MSSVNIESLVSNAWRLHRDGNNAQAINEFKAILDETPGSIDAFYGLGLAQRAEGESDAAIESFQKAFVLAKEAHEAAFSKAEGQPEHLMETSEDARFMMLQRMISQRLDELGVEE